MITAMALIVVAIALLSLSVVHSQPRAVREHQAEKNRVVRICAYCNLIMGVNIKALRQGFVETKAGHAPSEPGLILTHGMCQSCFNEQMRELDREP